MNFLKHFTVLLLALVIGLVGCKQKEKDIIKIGAVLPLTGNSAEIGNYTLKGLKQAIDEQNETGGLLGKKIVLLVEDSKAEPREGLNAINKLLRIHDPVLIYSIISGVTMAIRPITENNNKILVGAVGAVDFLDNCNYCIRNFVDPDYLGLKISSFLKDSLYAKRIGIFYANTEYGRTVKDKVSKHCFDKGLNVKFTESYEETGTNLKNIVLKNKNIDVDYIYVAGVGRSLGLVIKEIKEQKLTAEIIGDEMIPYPDVINAAGNAINDVYYLDFVFDLKSDNYKINDYIENFIIKYDSKPNNLTVITYEFMMIYFDVVKQIETTKTDKVMNYINNQKNIEGVFGNISINNNNVEYKFTIKKMQKND